MHTSAMGQQYSWDREKSIIHRRPTTTRQAVFRPSQWLKLRNNYLGVRHLSTAPAAPAMPAVPACYGSNESDDLQAMVHDFIENDPLDHTEGVDSDGSTSGKKVTETFQMRISQYSALERELLTEVKLLLLSMKGDSDLVCGPDGSDCKGGCVKRFVVRHLKLSGHDASVCKSKWLSSGRVPGGIHHTLIHSLNSPTDIIQMR